MPARKRWLLLMVLAALVVLLIVSFTGAGEAEVPFKVEDLGNYVGPYAR